MSSSDYLQVDGSWTLFLDRDGVINRKVEGDYVRTVNAFMFLPGALKALAELSDIFGKLIVVTNQQGVGKGLMTDEDVSQIHDFLEDEVRNAGGNLDAIYFAPQRVQEQSIMRKPGTGMAYQAKEDFPDIDFHKSIIAGDSKSDIEFGRKMGMVTVLINKEPKDVQPDYRFATLLDFARFITSG